MDVPLQQPKYLLSSCYK